MNIIYRRWNYSFPVHNLTTAPTSANVSSVAVLTITLKGHKFEPDPFLDTFTCRNCGWHLPSSVVLDEQVEVPCEAVPVAPEECSSCGADWCAELDAYYGRDPDEADMCGKCRLGR